MSRLVFDLKTLCRIAYTLKTSSNLHFCSYFMEIFKICVYIDLKNINYVYYFLTLYCPIAFNACCDLALITLFISCVYLLSPNMSKNQDFMRK